MRGCTSPPPLALHPGLDLYGFRVSRTLIALLSSYLSLHLSSLLEAGLVRTRGASLGLGVARGL